MANAKKTSPIRLSNRTAIGLRKTAQRVRGAWLIAMGVFAMLATVLAVYLGFMWLPAVPLTLMGAGVIIALMLLVSRSQYLLLISQAICTEAASRQMEERIADKKRRRKAIEELAALRADVREAEKRGVVSEGQISEASLLFDLMTGKEMSAEESNSRRQSEEDDELYAASYEGEEGGADEDLYPPKKEKKAKMNPAPVSMQSGSTKDMKKMPAVDTENQPEETAQEHTAPRRRRKAGAQAAQAAPLQLIRGEQAR